MTTPASRPPRPSDLEADELSESSQVWFRMKAVFGGRTTSFHRRRDRERAKAEGAPTTAEQFPFGPHREPVTTGDLLGQFFRRNEWSAPVAQAEVIEHWVELVGEQTAQHATPLHVESGVLVVQSDSTAWATQLRSIRATIIAAIADRYPAAAIDDLKVLNPGAPSWRHGRRSVPGRGPRDTYG